LITHLVRIAVAGTLDGGTGDQRAARPSPSRPVGPPPPRDPARRRGHHFRYGHRPRHRPSGAVELRLPARLRAGGLGNVAGPHCTDAELGPYADSNYASGHAHPRSWKVSTVMAGEIFQDPCNDQRRVSAAGSGSLGGHGPTVRCGYP